MIARRNKHTPNLRMGVFKFTSGEIIAGINPPEYWNYTTKKPLFLGLLYFLFLKQCNQIIHASLTTQAEADLLCISCHKTLSFVLLV